MEQSAKEAYAKLRSSVAETLVEFTLSVHQTAENVSSRILGTILNEALEWDSDVKIPEELSKAEIAVQPKVCGACGAANPAKSCPCGKAHYCDRACQKSGWKQHKRICSFKSK